MNHDRSRTDGYSRRAALGLLGAAPLAAAPLLTGARTALANEAGEGLDAGGWGRRLPPDLLPGGAYDRLIAERAAQGVFSGTVVLSYRGRPVLARAYGMANQQLSIPNRVDTIFSVASLSKVFAGIGIAQLAAQGAVAFSDSIDSYLAGFPSEVAPATLQQLYTHTSGLGDYQAELAWQNDRGKWTSAAQEFDETMMAIEQGQPQFLPGTSYSYSNSGYYTLGAIVSQVSGLAYADYVQQHILALAGMPNTGWFSPSEILSNQNIAHAYGPPMSNGQRADLTAQGGVKGRLADFGGGSGGGYSSAQDLLNFAMALRQYKLLQPAYTEFVMTGHYEVSPALLEPDQPQGEAFFSGCGFESRFVNQQRVFGHGGSSPVPGGISTNLSIYPDLDWVAVILGNYYFDIAEFLQLQDQLITSQSSRGNSGV